MELPEFLSTDDGGFIHLTGRRIGLHHLLRAYHDGLSPEEIALEYPGVPLATVHKVIAFYLDNREAVDAYVAEQNRSVEEQIAQSRPGPSVEELRSRLASRRVG